MLSAGSDLILAIQATPIAWPAFTSEILSMYEPPMCAKRTRDKVRHMLGQIEALGVTSTDQLNPELVARYITTRPAGQSPHTVRGNLMNLRTICSYAEGRRYVAVSPFRLRKLSKWIRVGPPAGKRHNSPEEIRRVLELMKADVETKRGWARWRAMRILALTSTVAYTGLRAAEAQCLWVVDVDLDRAVINLVPRGRYLPGCAPSVAGNEPRLKTPTSEQPIVMPDVLVPILRAWFAHRLDHPEGWPMPPIDRIPWVFPGSKRACAWSGTNGAPAIRPITRLKAVARRAGVEGMTFQSLRRSWCTRAEALGVPQALITRQARHCDTATTLRYYQQRDLGALHEAIGGFDYF